MLCDWRTQLPRMAYAVALAEGLPESVELWSHHLHCIFHSGVIAIAVELFAWRWSRVFWLPLAGW